MRADRDQNHREQPDRAPTRRSSESSTSPSSAPTPSSRSARTSLAAIVQPKLAVGRADDPLEREADAVADRVTKVLRRSGSAAGHVRPDEVDAVARVQRASSGHAVHRCGPGCARHRHVQRHTGSVGAEGGEIDGDAEARVRSASGGRPLDEPVRRSMEAAFGADFGAVRIHTGGAASDLSRSIEATAFTYGNDIFFRDGMPDTTADAGRSLLAHELTHTIQQTGGVGRKIQRKKTVITPPTGKDPIDDWVEYSGGGKPARSSKLKAIDTAIAAWVGGKRPMGGVLQGNIDEIDAILALVAAWQGSKKGKVSVRDQAIADLDAALKAERATWQGKLDAKNQNEAGSDEQLAEFEKMAPGMSSYARRIGATRENFFADRIGDLPLKRAVAKKDQQGWLTDEALTELDDINLQEQADYRAKASKTTMTVDPSLSTDQLREAMSGTKNPLSDRPSFPELANVTDPNGGPVGNVEEERTIAGSKFKITYDKSDVNASERIEALNTAVTAINAKLKDKVPDLEVLFPKLGRSLSIDGACKITEGERLADAIYIPPGFFAVSSQNVGNPKVDTTGSGEYKFLSTKLGPKNAMVHSIVHELGHAIHYAVNRKAFYNLSFAAFSGKAADGTIRQKLVEQEVSFYASNNPREMVAEVFLGKVIGGRTYSQEVMDMYAAFGGPPFA